MSGNENTKTGIKNMIRKYISVPLAFLIAVTLAAMMPLSAAALEITFEKSPDAPKGIELPPPDKMNPATPKAGSSGAPSGGTRSPGGQSSGEKKYTGIFRLAEPLKPVFPLKTGTVTQNITNFYNDTTSGVHLTRKNIFGNYYIEGGRSYGFVKDFKAKFQYNRQIKSTVTVNSMNEYSAKIIGVDLKYTRNANRNFQTDTTVADNRRLSVNYQKNKDLVLAYYNDYSINRTMSASPTRTTTRKETYTATWAITDNIKLNSSFLETANRNTANSPTTKAIQDEAKITWQPNKTIAFEIGTAFTGNRTLDANDANTRKLSNFANVSYQFAPKSRLTYKIGNSNERNYTVSSYTRYDTRQNEFLIQHEFFKWLKLTAANKATYNQSSGKATDRNLTLTVDHKKGYLPGSTSIQWKNNKNSVTATTSPSTSKNSTVTISSRLSYLDGHLNINPQYTGNGATTESPTTDSTTDSISRKVETSYKLTPTLTIANTVDKTENRNSSYSSGTSNHGATDNLSITDRITYIIRQPFTKRVKILPTVTYTMSHVRNSNDVIIPDNGNAETDVFKNTGVFNFKGKTWNGSYTLEKSTNKNHNTTVSFNRSNMQKFIVGFTDIYKCKFTLDYTITKANTGTSSRSGVLTLARKISARETLNFNYRLSRTTSDTASENNRIYDLAFETVF